MKLGDAQLYVCTDARKSRNDFAAFVDAAFAGGVDIIQLRDKTLDVGEELEFLSVLAAAAQRHGKLWAVNDRADIAYASNAPVFHAGQSDLPPPLARQLLNTGTAIGLSTHSVQQITDAMSSRDLDYFCVGPVWATPTKPGRPAVGLELIHYAAAHSRSTATRTTSTVTHVESAATQARSTRIVPWFAIGGIGLHNIERVVDAGANRVVVVRAITEAHDPTDAAQRLRAYLPPAPKPSAVTADAV